MTEDRISVLQGELAHAAIRAEFAEQALAAATNTAVGGVVDPKCKCPACFVRKGAGLIGTAILSVLNDQSQVAMVQFGNLAPDGVSALRMLVVSEGTFLQRIKPALEAAHQQRKEG